MRHLTLASLMLLGLLAMGSCSDDNTVNPNEPTVCPPAGGERIAYTAPRDTAFWHVDDWAGRQILGAGYDPNAAFLSSASVKAPVLDLDKISALDENRVQVIKSTEGDHMSVASADAAGLLQGLAQRTGVLNDGETAPLCSGTLLDDEAFRSDIDHSSMFSFAYNSTDYTYYYLRVNIKVMLAEVKRHPEEYLCDAFIADLAQLSAEDLIAKYGTHVLIDVKAGKAARSVSRTAVLGQDADNSRDWKREVADFYGGWARNVYHVPSLVSVNSNRYDGRYCGGTTSITFAGGDVSLLPAGQTKDFDAWLQKGCTLDNAALLKILDEPLPLYQLVGDESKADALQKATRKYLEQNKLTSIETALLVQTWMGGDYRYATTYEPDRDGGVCGIFVNQRSGMIPLYAYRGKYSDNVFTEATAVDQSILSAEGTVILGYIYATPQPGTVPLYVASVGQNGPTYCTLTDSPAYGEQGMWVKTGILGYVIPPIVE